MKAESWKLILEDLQKRREITRDVLYGYAVRDERPEIVSLANQYSILIALSELLREKITQEPK